MKINCFSLGQMQANCYFLIEDNNCLIIDPGDEADFILEKLQSQKLHLRGVMATHGHFDHVMAVGEIQKSFNVPFYISEKDMFLLDRVEKSAEYFLSHRPVILKPQKINQLKIKNSLKISNFKFEIIDTPGHTPGSLSFYFPEEKVIFTGDTLFKDGIGRYDFSYSSKKDLDNSLKELFKLPKNTIVYPGHGEETTIELEKRNINYYELSF